MGLLSLLSEHVDDPRRKQGQRNSLSQLFGIIIISNLCGHIGGRAVSRFAKLHKKTFMEVFSMHHPPPSNVTFSDLLNRTDEKQLISTFNMWAKDYVNLSDGEFMSGDGKALGSTFQKSAGGKQNFQAVVSMFCQRSGLIYSIEQYQNAKVSEIDIVRFLIKQLDAKGLVLFF